MIALQYSKADGFYFNVKLEINLKPAAFYEWIAKVSFLLRKDKKKATRSIGRLTDCIDGRCYLAYSARDQVPLELALLTACAKSRPDVHTTFAATQPKKESS